MSRQKMNGVLTNNSRELDSTQQSVQENKKYKRYSVTSFFNKFLLVFTVKAFSQQMYTFSFVQSKHEPLSSRNKKISFHPPKAKININYATQFIYNVHHQWCVLNYIFLCFINLNWNLKKNVDSFQRII